MSSSILDFIKTFGGHGVERPMAGTSCIRWWL
jgi:hypothetical protein